MSNPTDLPALAGLTALAYLSSLLGVEDPVIVELLLVGAGVFFAILFLSVIIPKGRKLKGIIASLVSGSVASILAIAFVPLEWRFIGLSGLVFFGCIVYLVPILNTFRTITRDPRAIRQILTRNNED